MKATLILLSSFIFTISAQSQFFRKDSALVFEKVYLQLDRSNYSAGDDIWFSAYLTNAFSGKLTDNSNCVYVEILSPDLRIIQRDVISLKNGLGHGDFKLADSLPSGRYLVRAYTSWMRNFGDLFFYTKGITIQNFSADPTDKGIAGQSAPEIRFFPESGSLVENVYSEVAFKAVDGSGNTIGASGKILSSTGDSVTSFVTTHLGMGSFLFTPKKEKDYFAVGTFSNGDTFKVRLPDALSIGFVLKTYPRDKEHLMITIKTNQETLQKYAGQKLFLLGSSKGKPCVTVDAKLRSPVQNILIPMNLFPAGISRITLFDNNYLPGNERLIFRRDNPVSMNITADKNEYQTREKVTLDISLLDTANIPVPANISIAAVDGNMETGNNRSDIETYFLLESEIKGTVQDPDYYFDSNADRGKAMDLLLMTQGWRDFIWKYLPDTINLKYPVEKGIVISGRLRRLLTDKPIANANISAGLFGGAENTASIAQTDSSGRYAIDAGTFFGPRTLVVTAANKNHRNTGMILLDSIFAPPASIEMRPAVPSMIRIDKSQSEEADRRYRILKQYRITDTIALGEVVVTGRKPQNINDDGNFRIYGNPDFVLKITDELSGFNDIFQLLQGRVAGLMISGVYPDVSFSFRGSHGVPLFLLDGVPVEIDFIASVPVSMIDKVEVLKDVTNLALFGMRGGSGVISVFTKKGAAWTNKPVFHTINTRINGFYQARVFYSPNYEVPGPEHQKPDLRTTIFWEPAVTVDSTGNARITFFNADTPTTVRVTAEGISNDGIPVHATYEYRVEKKD